jgi:mono/diheme cytochrome c family protein
MKLRTRAAALLLGCGVGPAISDAGDAADAGFRQNAGMRLFRTYCVGCHGLEAAGCGTSARLYRPRPANLTASTRDSDYKAAIIRNGGQSMGRSLFMPPWVGTLDDVQIGEIVEYLNRLAPRPTLEC